MDPILQESYPALWGEQDPGELEFVTDSAGCLLPGENLASYLRHNHDFV